MGGLRKQSPDCVGVKGGVATCRCECGSRGSIHQLHHSGAYRCRNSNKMKRIATWDTLRLGLSWEPALVPRLQDGSGVVVKLQDLQVHGGTCVAKKWSVRQLQMWSINFEAVGKLAGPSSYLYIWAYRVVRMWQGGLSFFVALSVPFLDCKVAESLFSQALSRRRCALAPSWKNPRRWGSQCHHRMG